MLQVTTGVLVALLGEPVHSKEFLALWRWLVGLLHEQLIWVPVHRKAEKMLAICRAENA